MQEARQKLPARQIACCAEYYDDVRLCAVHFLLSSPSYRVVRHVDDRNEGRSDSHPARVNTERGFAVRYYGTWYQPFSSP